ncbi:hypothetical protein [Metallosphaera hakonensis]|nr:hypothetical protein [Metallosphaera hakonensis]
MQEYGVFLRGELNLALYIIVVRIFDLAVVLFSLGNTEFMILPKKFLD